MHPLITITSSPTQSAFIVEVTGEVDLAGILEVGDRITQAPSPCVVVVDLSDVNQLTVAGLRLLRALDAVVAEQEIELVLVAPPGSTAHRLLSSFAPEEADAAAWTVEEALAA